MNLSWKAIERITAERAAKDPEIQAKLERNGRPMVAHGRAMSDEALIQKLTSLGVKIDRDWLDHFTEKYAAAQDLTKMVLDEEGRDIPDIQHDWVWIALLCLWERWFPERPNIEMLEDGIHDGYAADKDRDAIQTVEHWGRAWKAVRFFSQRLTATTFPELEDALGTGFALSEWIEQYSGALWRAAKINSAYLRDRINFCVEAADVASMPECDRWLRPSLQLAHADTLIELGETDAADSLFEEELQHVPQSKVNWSWWADLYGGDHHPPHRRDPEKAVGILERGLDVVSLEQMPHIAGDLSELLQELGRDQDADRARDRFPDAVMAELNFYEQRKLPRTALRAAQKHRELVTPALLRAIEGATAEARAGRDVETSGHFFAFFLLTEFRAKEALPAILEAVSLPGNAPFDLFGDSITEHLSDVLAALADDQPQLINQMIADRSLNEYVRWAAVDVFLYWVRDGLMKREEAVQKLREHLWDAKIEYDYRIANALVNACLDLVAHEAKHEIEDVFRRDLVSSRFCSWEYVCETLKRGDAHFQDCLMHCRPTGIDDTVALLEKMPGFRDPPKPSRNTRIDLPGPAPPKTPPPFFDGPEYVTATIRNTEAKVGRNEPCPCGSGKKYKKCCGKL